MWRGDGRNSKELGSAIASATLQRWKATVAMPISPLIGVIILVMTSQGW